MRKLDFLQTQVLGIFPKCFFQDPALPHPSVSIVNWPWQEGFRVCSLPWDETAFWLNPPWEPKAETVSKICWKSCVAGKELGVFPEEQLAGFTFNRSSSQDAAPGVTRVLRTKARLGPSALWNPLGLKFWDRALQRSTGWLGTCYVQTRLAELICFLCLQECRTCAPQRWTYFLRWYTAAGFRATNAKFPICPLALVKGELGGR